MTGNKITELSSANNCNVSFLGYILDYKENKNLNGKKCKTSL